MTPQLQATGGFAVTPNDSADLNIPGASGTAVGNGAAIYVGTEGSLKVTLLGGDTVTFAYIAAGTFLPIQVKRVWADGTDAGDIVALY